MQDTFSSTSAGPGPVFWIVACAIAILYLAGLWKVFDKAGQPGWAAIIPIYNEIVLIQVAGKPVWWILLYLIPVVGLIYYIIVMHNVSKNFGQGIGTTLGLLFLPMIFIPILAWGDAQYLGPTAGNPVPV